MTPRYIGLLAAALAALVPARPAVAHCDTTRGPVVTAARAALEAGKVELVLHWVRREDEDAVRAAFQQAREVRRLGPAARELAERHFFETLVRIHRAAEGAPYTGLSDAAPEPIIAATDRALELGSSDDLEQHLVDAVQLGLAQRFAAAHAARGFRPGDVEAGRAYVAAYVSLTHWVEGVALAAEGAGGHHAAAPQHDAAARDTSGAGAPRYLPWLLSGLLALAALLEGAFLLRRRRHTAV